MGLRAITTESTESIEVIEKMVKEYDICVAYHNHPRRSDNPNYKVWDPNYIRALPRCPMPHWGLCGHRALASFRSQSG